MQYGRDLQQLKIIVEAEGKVVLKILMTFKIIFFQKTVQEKLLVIDKIPKHYSIAESIGMRKRKCTF
jgi:hypothetical protein